MTFDFRADVDIDADMWFGISLSTPLFDDHLYIECDRPDDGLAFLWEHLAERFPERVPALSSRKDRSEPLATLISAALVEQYKVSEEHWRDVSRHHDVRSDGSPPEVHYADLHLYVLAEKNIRNMWGVNALDAAIGKAFGG